MADGKYLKGIEQMGLGNINLETDTIVLAPMAVAYTPSYASESWWSDISSSIASGATLFTLASTAYDIDAANLRVEFDSNDVSESNQTFASDKFVLLKWTGTASTSPLLACISFTEGTLAPVAGTFAVTVNAEGWYSDASA